MKKNTFTTILAVGLGTLISCSQKTEGTAQPKTTDKTNKKELHKYGGWYCPDNLNGFPPVDIKNWKSVPVIEGRLPTQEETKSETSLIHIDTEKYPNAKVIQMDLPKLATYYTDQIDKEEIVIIIQAFEIDEDSIIGFRYLNGGNGSARFKDFRLLDDEQIENLPTSNFVTLNIKINSNAEKIWEVMTGSIYAKELQTDNTSHVGWGSTTNVNFNYADNKFLTSSFADILYGCYYVQNDYKLDYGSYVDKFLLLENKADEYTDLKIVCGPYLADFKLQKNNLTSWANKVKELSETENPD